MPMPTGQISSANGSNSKSLAAAAAAAAFYGNVLLTTTGGNGGCNFVEEPTPSIAMSPGCSSSTSSSMSPMSTCTTNSSCCTATDLTPPLSAHIECMKRYLDSRDELRCTIVFAYPLGIQKSYGQEKRYACPIPRVELVGSGWSLLKSSSLNMPLGGCLNTGDAEFLGIISLPAAGQPGVSDPSSKPHNFKFHRLASDTGEVLHSKGSQDIKIWTPSMRPFISLSLELRLSSGFRDLDFGFGKIPSSRIKIMSKPSKKRQSAKSGELDRISIRSGTTVAFYNRPKAQTMNTKYMAFDAKKVGFTTTASAWGAFEIYAVDGSKSSSGKTFTHSTGNIYYGNIVRLVHRASGVAMPPMRIRRVETEKQQILAKYNSQASEEPVSQMHPCALEVLLDGQEASAEYLSSLSIGSFVRKSAQKAENQFEHVISESSKWTIMSVQVDSHTFALLSPRTSGFIPISPIPTVLYVNSDQKDGAFWLEFIGDHFSVGLTPWLGCCPAETTVFRSSSCLSARVPSLAHFLSHYEHHGIPTPAANAKRLLSVPLSFVRFDGVLYETGFSFGYNPRQCGDVGEVCRTDEGRVAEYVEGVFPPPRDFF